MILFYTFRIHLGSLAALFALLLLGSVMGEESGRVYFEHPFVKTSASILLCAWAATWLWLLVSSWMMLFRSWRFRTSLDNTKLFLILFIFSFLGAYYFYWKRFEIDSRVA